MPFTHVELDYLKTQRMARLATIGPAGAPQLRPVVFELNLDLGTIDIGGWDMGATQKYRNVRREPRVSIVIDDVVCYDPFVDRGIEVRGRAEPIGDHGPMHPGYSDEIIRVHPRRIVSWGLDPATPGITARDVA
ncbi:PPOX class F420-dependent oxidoreductase [Marinitenerispora sediminis]|uniref:PPOX class F420-dependent oxidoreductase n=2 Tax=Marinitenerispora sediminis TaxID=1931232 RepID=A0A368SZF2_9ACTN|nr:PPOX class F420-dependent oxidoreductase [Marinitenerispora sediminis]RCV48017.1 PPOX class F420-dependent oxidoreductase [Marinitenerispora sediminis]RCV51019.1 PPOX class F420-dependent oxidoreductase [Marinitenerispora sediminis]